MSMPNIPDIHPDIKLSREDIVNLLLASVAMEEIGLARILDAEGGKIQKMFEDKLCASPEEIRDVNASIERMAQSILKLQMMLDAKVERILCLTTPHAKHPAADSGKAQAAEADRTSCDDGSARAGSGAAAAPPAAGHRHKAATEFRLAGRGEGYVEHADFLSCGIAELRVVPSEDGKGCVAYVRQMPAYGRVLLTAFYADHIEMKGRTQADRSPGGEIRITLRGKGTAISRAGRMEPLRQDARFALTYMQRGHRRGFRMVIESRDGTFRQDSGEVDIISGDLKATPE